MKATTTPAQGTQYLQALQRANEVRLARAELKRQVADGRISAAEVILRCTPEVERMTVADLLLSQPRWGPTRCRRLLVEVPLSESKTVGSMTERQRRVLVAVLTRPE